jgi:hypothetical protein
MKLLLLSFQSALTAGALSDLAALFHGSRASSCPDSPHASIAGWDCRCACAFVDVGLNDGLSLTTWPSILLRKGRGPRAAKYELPYDSPVREAFASCYANRTSARFFGFEGNAKYTPTLERHATRLREVGGYSHVHMLTGTVLGIADGETSFFRDPQNHGLGSSLAADKLVARTVDRANRVWTLDRDKDVGSNYQRVIVPSLGAASLFRRLGAWSDFVAIKIDVEGFEFALMKSLLSDASSREALCAVDVLGIEWHSHLFNNSVGHRELAQSLATQVKKLSCGNANGRRAHAPVVVDLTHHPMASIKM